MTDTTAIVIRSIDDLSLIQESWTGKLDRLEALHFDLERFSPRYFSRFVGDALPGILTARLQHVTRTQLQAAGIDWTRTASRDFIEQLSVLPNLKHFSWISKAGRSSNENGIPIPLLTIFCSRCQGLESLSLDGLQLLTSAAIHRVPRQDNTTVDVVSETLQYFCTALRNHASLKLFRLVHCQIHEAGPPAGSREPVRPVTALESRWVDEFLKSLVYVGTLECIVIREAPYKTNPGRALLGLCKDGPYTETAIEGLMGILQQQKPQHPYEKLRLWFADGYERQNDDPPMLLNLCDALSHNTTLEDVRIRGGDTAATRFITPDVLAAYKDLLESGRNLTLTSCDLMTRQQGGPIDLYCRLNEMGRKGLMERLHFMTREEWIQDVLLRFASDLDALYYWIRLQPVFIASLDTA